ncbi:MULTISPECIES: XrtA/PEP-CTERM system exopolysaccharide export protein [unclassified Iodidimonas]|jgi:polysaccharide export outer membrane protein|uniref:XrtA/PEP-CTERM system exopolysaccharide export protein n=1 Tax=unclassified Iodidimonas TaxID=2626145 RepID=UPI0024824CF2|nr:MULTISPECIES: XrtA/PEP-CTERM system exopolysaccharide export protein [unclassified Iodidimonas]
MIIRALALLAVCLVAACASKSTLPPVDSNAPALDAPLYRIGPGDSLNIFVWRNPDLASNALVRPDGRITLPLIDDLEAAGKTPTELARDIEGALSVFVQDPLVTVMVTGFVGTFEQQVRVVGAAANPSAIPYRANMTLLDVMIAVGGLTEFAAGNRATLVRWVDGEQKEYRVRLDSLLKSGNISANTMVLPGDILIIPETFL